MLFKPIVEAFQNSLKNLDPLQFINYSLEIRLKPFLVLIWLILFVPLLLIISSSSSSDQSNDVSVSDVANSHHKFHKRNSALDFITFI